MVARGGAFNMQDDVAGIAQYGQGQLFAVHLLQFALVARNEAAHVHALAALRLHGHGDLLQQQCCAVVQVIYGSVHDSISIVPRLSLASSPLSAAVFSPTYWKNRAKSLPPKPSN